MEDLTPVVLVTGAAGGIGRATVQTFSQAGWQVIATDVGTADPPPGAAAFVAGDLGAPDGVTAVAAAVRAGGRLDALVNNAAVQIAKPLLETRLPEWDQTMNVNVRAVFLLAQALFPLLAASRGSVVNVASVHATATSSDLAAYAASKGALLALTRAMAIEFAPAGIRVNAVLPGAINTPMLHAGLQRGHPAGAPAERLAELGRRTALGRLGRPEEIAEAILFLADTRRSSFVTGQALTVDGGATARLSTE